MNIYLHVQSPCIYDKTYSNENFILLIITHFVEISTFVYATNNYIFAQSQPPL